jgi:hypothetical protein
LWPVVVDDGGRAWPVCQPDAWSAVVVFVVSLFHVKARRCRLDDFLKVHCFRCFLCFLASSSLLRLLCSNHAGLSAVGVSIVLVVSDFLGRGGFARTIPDCRPPECALFSLFLMFWVLRRRWRGGLARTNAGLSAVGVCIVFLVSVVFGASSSLPCRLCLNHAGRSASEWPRFLFCRWHGGLARTVPDCRPYACAWFLLFLVFWVLRRRCRGGFARTMPDCRPSECALFSLFLMFLVFRRRWRGGLAPNRCRTLGRTRVRGFCYFFCFWCFVVFLCLVAVVVRPVGV